MVMLFRLVEVNVWEKGVNMPSRLTDNQIIEILQDYFGDMQFLYEDEGKVVKADKTATLRRLAIVLQERL